MRAWATIIIRCTYIVGHDAGEEADLNQKDSNSVIWTDLGIDMKSPDKKYEELSRFPVEINECKEEMKAWRNAGNTCRSDLRVGTGSDVQILHGDIPWQNFVWGR